VSDSHIVMDVESSTIKRSAPSFLPCERTDMSFCSSIFLLPKEVLDGMAESPDEQKIERPRSQ
jgi:hypothetical protein